MHHLTWTRLHARRERLSRRETEGIHRNPRPETGRQNCAWLREKPKRRKTRKFSLLLETLWDFCWDEAGILRGMVPDSPAQAGCDSLLRRREAIGASRSRLVETTLTVSGILRHMTDARRSGYRIVLRHVSVAASDKALDLVRSRVVLDGHDVPEADARRRFAFASQSVEGDGARGRGRASRQLCPVAPGGRDPEGRDLVGRRSCSRLGCGGSRSYRAAEPVTATWLKRNRIS